jgi:uncharacterized membrane protein YciS (DUF1049 family)
MPWRLIAVVAVFVVFLFFISFNLDNKCNISFGFTVIEEAPVFLTIFISFGLGFITTIPFVFFLLKKKKGIIVKEKPEKKKGFKNRFFSKKHAPTDGGKLTDGGSHDY